jgi:hypothetical protein
MRFLRGPKRIGKNKRAIGEPGNPNIAELPTAQVTMIEIVREKIMSRARLTCLAMFASERQEC